MWYPRACLVCRGDMYDDVDEPERLICLMCGRSIHVHEVRAATSARLVAVPAPPAPLEIAAAAA